MLRVRDVLGMFTVPRLVLVTARRLATAHDRRCPLNEKVPIVVVIGIDMDNRPHASRFADHDAPVVARAAELMGFHVVRVPADQVELHGIAKRLPLGKIFASGRAFVPFVARSTFDTLAALAEGGITIDAPSAPRPAPASPL